MLYIMIGGFIMALADSVPGVSGGTIAFILGFYDEFICSINNLMIKNQRKKAIIFLIKLGLGWLLGFVLAVMILNSIFETYIYDISSLFIGFIIASIPIIINYEKPSFKNKNHLVYAIIAFVFVVLLTYFASSNINIDPNSLGLLSYVYFFFAGVLAVSAMVLPGISGSSIMYILGLYLPIIQGIRQLMSGDFSSLLILLVFLIGIIFGALYVSGILKNALANKRSIVMYTVIGLMTGSIVSIFYGPKSLHLPVLSLNTFSVWYFIIGIVLVSMLEGVKRWKNA